MPTKIGWADETVSPLGHGCYGPGGTAEKPNRCSYCYAYKLAKRNMRGCELCRQFIPHTHFEQLDKLQKWVKPKKIFMQSMGDMFHDFVSIDWIKQVFEACAKAPQHHYIFLTKNAARINYDEELMRAFYKLIAASIGGGSGSINIGITATNQREYTRALRALHAPHFLANTFISIEPIHSYIDVVRSGFANISWVIVGIETGNRKGKIVAPDEWITDIIMRCAKYKKPLFIKEPLSEKHDLFNIKEFPETLT